MIRQLFLLPFFLSLVSAALTAKGVDWSAAFFEKGSRPATWTTTDGKSGPLETLLKANGANMVRQRVWVGESNVQDNLRLAKRAQKEELSVYLDLHFSETWSDPGKQPTPKAWEGQNIDQLCKTVQKYTSDTLTEFKNAGIDVGMVSIGNEIRNGLLFPVGRIGKDGNAVNAARLLKAASVGVREVKFAKPPAIMIHLDSGWNGPMMMKWFQRVLAANALQITDFEAIGLSYYPFYGGGAATMSSLSSSIKALKAKYHKEVHIVETQWPKKCTKSGNFPADTKHIPFSPAGQAQWIEELSKLVSNAGGNGLFWWEPFMKGNPGGGVALRGHHLRRAQRQDFLGADGCLQGYLDGIGWPCRGGKPL